MSKGQKPGDRARCRETCADASVRGIFPTDHRASGFFARHAATPRIRRIGVVDDL